MRKMQEKNGKYLVSTHVKTEYIRMNEYFSHSLQSRSGKYMFWIQRVSFHEFEFPNLKICER